MASFFQPKQQEQERIATAAAKSSADHGDAGIDEEVSSKLATGKLSRRNSTTSVHSHASGENMSVANSWIFNKTIDVGGM